MAKLSGSELYAHRIANALAKGYSKSQARGHPSKHELAISISKRVSSARKPVLTLSQLATKQKYDKRVNDALAKGFSRSQARGHAKRDELPLSYLKTESSKLSNRELSRRGIDLLNELLGNENATSADKVRALELYKTFRKSRSKDDFYEFLRHYSEILGRSDYVSGFNIGGPS